MKMMGKNVLSRFYECECALRPNLWYTFDRRRLRRHRESGKNYHISETQVLPDNTLFDLKRTATVRRVA